MTEVDYSFTVRGVYPDGNKAKMNGYVTGPPGYPTEVFDKAVKVCIQLTPEFRSDKVALKQLKKRL